MRRCGSTISGQLMCLILVAWGVCACQSEIGDSCSTNLDCSPLGDRICDTSRLEGYCTIEGCGARSCGDNAVCVRFFSTAFSSVSCDPAKEDAVDPSIQATNDCTSDEICITSGFCVNRGLERRFCMQTCEDDSDCRGGYECRTTGTRGAEPVIDLNQLETKSSRFCGQKTAGQT